MTAPLFYSAKTLAVLLDCKPRDVYGMTAVLRAKGVKIEKFGRRTRYYAASVHEAFADGFPKRRGKR